MDFLNAAENELQSPMPALFSKDKSMISSVTFDEEYEYAIYSDETQFIEERECKN